MDDINKNDVDNKSEDIQKQNKPDKAKDEKRKPSKRELQRRKQLRDRCVIFAVAAFIIILAVIFIPRALSEMGSSSASDGDIALAETDTSGLRHLSFDMLSTGSGTGRMTAQEFEQALQKLYDDGYVLVDIYDIATKNEDGSLSFNEKITVPEGKKPLIISQREIAYPPDSQMLGVCNKLVIDNGNIKAEYIDGNGQSVVGDYDVVPILETFIKEHPDFSYNGARAILGVSGYCGVLGYRTTSYFSGTENNPYAAYGTFDTASETEAAKKVVDELKSLGYHFASYGFADDISYGAEYSIVEADVQQWQSEVASVVGDTDLIIFPKQTDIAGWKGYTEDNPKYELLSGLGFKFYFINNTETPDVIQVENGYIRQTIYEINTYVDFANAIQ